MMLWDLAAAKRSATMAEHSGSVWALAYSEGAGSILASGGPPLPLLAPALVASWLQWRLVH